MNNLNYKKGITLVELIVAIAIIAAIAVVLGRFQGDIFYFNGIIQDDLNAQMEGRRAIRILISDLREASSSSLGSYPIAAAATSTVTFFSDVDGDTLKEQVRYYVQNKNVIRGIIKPSGNPLTYNPASENLTTVVKNISNDASTPIFEYYDTNYSGNSSPLSIPVDILAIRLVKAQLVIDRDPTRSPNPLTITSQVSVRNLKDNL